MSKNYINNREFEQEIKVYLLSGAVNQDKLFSMFDLLIDNLYFSYNFTLEYEDAKQECFVLILKKLPTFDPNRGSAFNFFTTLILNNLRGLFTSQKRKIEGTLEYIEYLKFIDSNSPI